MKGKNIQHSAEAIAYNRHFSEFFVGETRKNNNHFLSQEEEDSKQIDNYTVVSGVEIFDKIYVF